MKFTTYLLFLVGFISTVYGIVLFVQRYNPSRIAFNNYPSSYKVGNLNDLPTRLIIPSAQIDVPILPAKPPKPNWNVTEKGASYLTSSPLPGKPGNSVIYGHNWTNILGNLSKARPGSIMQIYFSSGNKLQFKIIGKGTITPDQTHVLNDSKDARITLYTCTGFLDSKRLVVTAVYQGSASEPISYSKLILQ